MSEYIEVGQPLQFTDPNTPTRVGEIVENVSDIYNIPSPRLGMQVFVKSEKKSFVITSLKNKVIGGVDVPEAAVEAFEPVGAKSITWNNDADPSNMNDFVVAGVYDIKGEHTREDDNLPILNTGGGHTFNARLTVLDSSITGSGNSDDKCITQVLSFCNRLGQGEVYIRTGKGSSLDNLIWENWSTLQRNVNVGEVGSLDDLIDNGIYSGVWSKGYLLSYPLTFVCVVINDYFIGTAPRRISQFVYGLSKFDGSVVYQSRVWDDSKSKWSDWEILNKKEISSMINDAIKGIIADAPEAFDTLKEIADWIANDETGAVALANATKANAAAITAERTRAIGQEGLLNNAIAEEKGRAEQTEQAIDDKLDEEIERSVAADQDLLSSIDEEARRATQAEGEINQNTIAVDSISYSTTTDDISLEYETLDGQSTGSVTIPSATTEKAGVMSAEDKKQLYSTDNTLIYNSSSLSNGYVDGNADTYTETATTAIKYMAVPVEEGMKCTLTSVRRNLGYMYIIYNANDEKITHFQGTNATVITREFTIPEGGVKLAVNCDSAYLDNFSLSIVGNPTLLSRVDALEKEFESINIDEIDNKIADIEKQVASTEQNIFNYNSSSLSKGYVDGSKSELTVNTSPSYISHLIVDVAFGNVCKLNTARYNNGYNYIIYNSDNEMIAYHQGENYVLENLEFTIPEGGVKLAVNCDTAKIDGFSLSIVGNPTLLSRVIELEKENVEFDVLSAKNRIVYTLGSSTIDLMKTATNADGVKDWSYLGQLLGAKKLYNIAIGGSTWQTQGIDTDAPDINTTATRSASNQIKMLKRLVDSGKYEYPEIIFLQFTNGYSGSGTITDNMEQVMAMSFDELEANANIRLTFYGGVRYALELLNRYFPKATYYVSDGIQCDRDLPYRRGYEYVKSGREALKKMCDRYSCPFLETSRSIGIVDLYEHGSKTSTSNIEIFTGATATGTIVLSLKDNDIDVSVTAGDTANVVAQKIANTVNSSNTGWTAQLNGSKVLLSVAKESAAVPEFNAASTGVSVDITFNQFADDYDGIYLSTDGLHPNEKGKQLIARCVAKGILGTYFEKQ